MNRRSRSRGTSFVLVLAVLAMLVTLVMSGCHKKKEGASGDPSASAPAPFEVRDSSEGLMLTWIDEKGDFHVEQKVADVPMVGRDGVRVVDPTREEGTHADHIFVADLRTTQKDGTYAVKAMSKAEFDAIAVTRRKAHDSPILADTEGGAPGPLANGGGNGADPSGKGPDLGPTGTRPAVIIYGAEWCGACHEAAAYLRRKGIPFIEKDVEADHLAQQEMQEKLHRTGLRGGSIPVLDVRGKVMVGFSAHAIDEALGQAL